MTVLPRGFASFLTLLESAHLELGLPLFLALPTSTRLLWLSVLSWKPRLALLGLAPHVLSGSQQLFQ